MHTIPESMFPILLNQLIQISCVAILAIFVTKSLRSRPHVVHAAWLLVLLKCITPPVLASPTSPFSWAQTILVRADATAPSHHSRAQRAEQQDSGEPALQPVVVTLDTAILREDAADRWNSDIVDSWKTFRLPAFSLIPIQLILLGWLSISTAIFTLINVRLLRFLRLVERTRIGGENHGAYLQRVERLAEHVEFKLGMRHRVHIQVLDALVGPAIIGVLRPTILLPKVVVDTSPDKQLETLIAHELVHFRRGDLWWSALQAIAVCGYWCNPLIWVARTAINREAEKCCDEETSGSLNCEPGEYARCLMSVLECKHTLRAAPLLPGVRPVDITAERLERIMELRHGCHRHCPGWVWATLVLSAVVLLPGASLSLAQHGTDKKPRPASDSAQPTIQSEQRSSLGRVEGTQVTRTNVGRSQDTFYFFDDMALEQAGYRLESFDVTEVLRKFANAEATSSEAETALLLSRLPKGEYWKSETETTPSGVTAQVASQESERVLKLGDQRCRHVHLRGQRHRADSSNAGHCAIVATKHD